MIKTSIKKHTHTIWGGFVLLETLKWGKHFTLSFCSNRWVVVCCCQFGYLGSVTLLWLSDPGYLASVTWRGEEVEPGAFSICWRLVFCCLFSVFFFFFFCCEPCHSNKTNCAACFFCWFFCLFSIWLLIIHWFLFVQFLLTRVTKQAVWAWTVELRLFVQVIRQLDHEQFVMVGLQAFKQLHHELLNSVFSD